MKILSAAQIKALDAFTIENEPITSIDLMERASNQFTNWFCDQFPDTQKKVYIFCGMGNNGGDGLAVARLLHQRFYNVVLFICKFSDKGTDDFITNLSQLPPTSELPYFWIEGQPPFPIIEDGIMVDAMFGIGINRPISEKWSGFFNHLNQQNIPIVSIDIPSGVHPDRTTHSVSIHADYTLSFELPKLAFLLSENEKRIGHWELVTIHLHQHFIEKAATKHHYIDLSFIQSIIKIRNKFDHKGSFGHALMIAGSKGKIGAAVLASKACLKMGAGLVTTYLPPCGYDIIQQSIPEVMALTSEDENHVTPFNLDKKHNAIGIGPGLDNNKLTKSTLINLLKEATVPLVIDADALNIIAEDLGLLKKLPAHSILTPHPGEFKRLFGTYTDDFQRLEAQREIAKDLNCYLILKGAHTSIAAPDGNVYFNSTGNPGMATAGSGDVLTGMITGLIAQGYSSLHASIFGVYMHGFAGDLAIANEQSYESLLASEIIDYIGYSFKEL